MSCDLVHYVPAAEIRDTPAGPVEDPPGWYFWDEILVDRYGPYPTEVQARHRFRVYCTNYLGDFMFKGETILSSDPSAQKEMQNDPHISEFRVRRSPAGYYIGTIFTYDGCEKCLEEYGPPEQYSGFTEPNSRETDYFATEAEALQALDMYKKTGVLPNQRF